MYELSFQLFNKNIVNPESWYYIGAMYDYGKGVSADLSEAIKWHQKSATYGYADGQFALALMYRHGRGIDKNKLEEISWLRKTAEQGHIVSQFALASAYLEGDGILENQNEAIKWYKKAADQGDANSMEKLGEIFEYRLTNNNYKEAFDWYKKAAECGRTKSQAIVGLFYETGRGVPKNLTEAKKWYKFVAKKNDGEWSDFAKKSCHRLGVNW